MNCIIARCLINVVYLTACAFIRSWWRCTLLNDVTNDTKSIKNKKKYVINASLKSETMGKLIFRIPGLLLLIWSLPGSALRTQVESLDKPRNVNKRSQSLALKNLISKDTHLVFFISWQASQCQQAFSKPCLLNLISKDTHLVFSISLQTLRCQQSFSKPCLLNLISKDTHLVFSMSRQTLRCQQSFSKPCLINLISKDTHLVFSICHSAALIKSIVDTQTLWSLFHSWKKF